MPRRHGPKPREMVPPFGILFSVPISSSSIANNFPPSDLCKSKFSEDDRGYKNAR